MTNQHGISLLELMITIAIVAIVITLGSPAIINAQRNLALAGAVENSYFAFQQARSHAVRQSSDILVDVTAGSNWCIGATDQADCDCSVAASCTVDGVEQVLDSQDYPQVTMQNLSFGGDNQAVFDGVRGLSLGSAGTLELAAGATNVRISLNDVGRVSICIVSGELGSYQACGV